MTIEYIRNFFKVDAQIGMQVDIDGKKGVITAGSGKFIHVLFEGKEKPERCHPKWKITYFNNDGTIAQDFKDKQLN